MSAKLLRSQKINYIILLLIRYKNIYFLINRNNFTILSKIKNGKSLIFFTRNYFDIMKNNT